MPNFRNPRPMATRPPEEKEQFVEGRDFTRKKDDLGYDATFYSDGSSTYHFGGPCLPVNYDENGEEI